MGFLRKLFGKVGSELPAYVQDHQIPARRLIHGFLALYTGDDGDPRHTLDEEANQEHLKENWGCAGPDDLVELMDTYEGEGEYNLAFDLVRAIKLARHGAGAGWISDTESWERCFRCGERLKEGYQRWEDVYADCQKGREQWWRESQERPIPPDQIQHYADRFVEAKKLIFSQMPLNQRG